MPCSPRHQPFMPRLPMMDGSLKPVSTTTGASPPVIRKPSVGTCCAWPGSSASTRKLVSSSMSPRSRTFTSRPIRSSFGDGIRWVHYPPRRARSPSHVRMRTPSSEQAANARRVDGLAARRGVELAKEVARVGLRRRLADAQALRDLLEAQALLQALEQRLLARGEHLNRSRALGRPQRAHRGLDA